MSSQDNVVDLIEAMESTLNLARDNLARSANLPDTRKLEESLNCFEDMLFNHWERLEDIDASEAGRADTPYTLGEIRALREIAPDSYLNISVVNVLALAEVEIASGCADPEAARRAISVSARFWATHGREIVDGLYVIPFEMAM